MTRHWKNFVGRFGRLKAAGLFAAAVIMPLGMLIVPAAVWLWTKEEK